MFGLHKQLSTGISFSEVRNLKFQVLNSVLGKRKLQKFSFCSSKIPTNLADFKEATGLGVVDLSFSESKSSPVHTDVGRVSSRVSDAEDAPILKVGHFRRAPPSVEAFPPHCTEGRT